MHSSVDHEVLEQLAAYLAGAKTLPEFRRWFMPRAWDLGQAESNALPLTRTVELRLAEFSSGHWTEDELREVLLGLLDRPVTVATARSSVNHWSGRTRIAWSEPGTASDKVPA